MSEQYYRIMLDDYSAASFTSFDKPYFGTMRDLEGWISAIENEECFAKSNQSLTETFRAYQDGQCDITHNVAYREVRFLDKATLLHRECYFADRLAWKHLNTWRWPYFMRCDKVESVHLWLSCKGQYYRCVVAKFVGLRYGTDEKEWTLVDSMLWGYPKVLETNELPRIWNRLAEPEKIFKTMQEAEDDWKRFKVDPDPVFQGFCNDIFGDG